MKKMGIITIHDSTNCGALLQAFALQETVKKFNVDCEVIDHKYFLSSSHNVEKRNMQKGWIFMYIKSLLKCPTIACAIIFGRKMTKDDGKQKNNVFQIFKENYLNLTNRTYTSEEEIYSEPPVFDAYICGSDQIWSPERIGYAKSFFLDFVPKGAVKIAYAPSLGVSQIPENYYGEYRSLLEDFLALSLREQKGAEQLENILQRNVETLVDPTFLLDGNYWESFARNMPSIKDEKYIFCYFLNHLSIAKSRKLINEFASKYHCKVIVAKPGYSKLDSSWKPALGVGPKEFVNYIMNANYVFTDSFHGVAFSINLNKQFFVYKEIENGIFESRFERILNLLNVTGLEKRIFTTQSRFDNFRNNETDFSLVNIKLEQERKKSNNYLLNALSSVNSSEKEDDISVPANKDDCIGCGVCEKVCNHDAITMAYDEDGFLMPFIQKNKCISCGLCKVKCPVINPPELESSGVMNVYATTNKDESILKQSSSGGVFYEIARNFIEAGGIVYGAAFDEKMILQHYAVSCEKKIEELMGSKYIQSDISKIFSSIKENILNDKDVLFVGTPCQICAVKKAIGNTNRITYCDLICHGVASNGIFSNYLNKIEKDNGISIIKYKFRDKKYGWLNPSISYIDNKEKKHIIRWLFDPFIQAYSKDKLIRESCLHCKFSVLPRYSDITLADYWGVKKYNPELMNKFGVSSVLVHSEKGQVLINRCKNLSCNTIKIDPIMNENKSICSSSRKSVERDSLFYDFRTKGFECVYEKYMRVQPLWQRVIKKLIRR